MTDRADAKRRLLAASAAALANAAAASPPPFGPLSSHTVINPFALAVGDLDGDGAVDRVIVGDRETSVALGNGAGRFFERQRLPISGAQALLTDVTGDGALDLIVLALDGGSASLLPGLGDGGLGPAIGIPLPGGVEGVALADVTGDGRVDLLAASPAAQSVFILAGDGAGAFTDAGSVSTPLLFGAGLFAAADVDLDGAIDLVASGPVGATVHFGDGAGGFPVRAEVGDGAALNRIAVLDADANGLPDVVAFDERAQLLSAFKQFTPRSFLPATSIARATRVARLVAADANGDGAVDLISLHTGSQTGRSGVDVIEGGSIPLRGGEYRVFFAGDGLLREGPRYFGGGWPQDLCVADVNADGAPDLVEVARPFTEFPFFVLGEPGADSDGAGAAQVALGLGDGAFAGASRVASARASGVAIEDLDGDGDLDLIETQVIGVLVRRNSGLGVFDVFAGGVNSEGLPTFDQPFAIGDATGDGKSDLLLASSSGLRLAPGRGNGLFDQIRTVNQIIPTAIATGDFTGDGQLQVVIGAPTQTGARATILRQATPTLFEPVTTLDIPADPRAIATADFDGDGVLDAAFACRDGRALAVVSFAPTAPGPPVKTFPLPNPARSVTAIDFDRDGDQDLAVAEDGPHASLTLFRNVGGVIKLAGRIPIDSASDVCTCDATLDGWPDLLVADSVNDRVLVFAGNGAGGFAEVASVFTGDFPRSIACGDLNGDNRPDIVVSANNERPTDITSRTFSAMTVHLNGLVPAGDANRDRRIDARDITVILSAFGPCPAGACPADLTGDGVVDGADLTVVLSNFGR
ncbi:MAG: hypothetical protein D6693_07355 [Planctomycetota bacterium]|nr:MAG: hypothetical protein D6693_07355 [Planctomycetota bacterium]